jgi:hypothetical protein
MPSLSVKKLQLFCFYHNVMPGHHEYLFQVNGLENFLIDDQLACVLLGYHGTLWRTHASATDCS